MENQEITNLIMFAVVGILIALVGFSFGVSYARSTNYCENTVDPLGWTDSKIYQIIRNYNEEDYPYIGNDIFDCDHISTEVAHRLKLAGYNASVIGVSKVDECYTDEDGYMTCPVSVAKVDNETNSYHALVKVNIWLDYGEIVTPNIDYQYEYTLTKDRIEGNLLEHEESFPQTRIEYENYKQ